jgi:anti-sigma regulatory factor (Ser/Thr protein kinase)
MSLQSVIIDENTREYRVKEDEEGSVVGRALPAILDVRREELRSLLHGQLEQFCRRYSVNVKTDHFDKAADELPTNAFRYGNGGNPVKEVVVRCALSFADEKVGVDLQITDEGAGIPDAIWNRTEEDVLELYQNGTLSEGGWGLLILKGISTLTREGRGNIIRCVMSLPLEKRSSKSE